MIVSIYSRGNGTLKMTGTTIASAMSRITLPGSVHSSDIAGERGGGAGREQAVAVVSESSNQRQPPIHLS